jgi:hypothetical protein
MPSAHWKGGPRGEPAHDLTTTVERAPGTAAVAPFMTVPGPRARRRCVPWSHSSRPPTVATRATLAAAPLHRYAAPGRAPGANSAQPDAHPPLHEGGYSPPQSSVIRAPATLTRHDTNGVRLPRSRRPCHRGHTCTSLPASFLVNQMRWGLGEPRRTVVACQTVGRHVSSVVSSCGGVGSRSLVERAGDVLGQHQRRTRGLLRCDLPREVTPLTDSRRSQTTPRWRQLLERVPLAAQRVYWLRT